MRVVILVVHIFETSIGGVCLDFANYGKSIANSELCSDNLVDVFAERTLHLVEKLFIVLGERFVLFTLLLSALAGNFSISLLGVKIQQII